MLMLSEGRGRWAVSQKPKLIVILYKTDTTRRLTHSAGPKDVRVGEW